MKEKDKEVVKIAEKIKKTDIKKLRISKKYKMSWC